MAPSVADACTGGKTLDLICCTLHVRLAAVQVNQLMGSGRDSLEGRDPRRGEVMKSMIADIFLVRAFAVAKKTVNISCSTNSYIALPKTLVFHHATALRLNMAL